MQEEFEEKPRKSIDWKYYLALARRRSWYFLIPFFFGWLMIWVASWSIPATYRSGTLILIEQPTVPQQFVVPNVAGGIQDRLQSITQQILSRTRLLHIIDVANLYPEYRGRETPDGIVEKMRKDIEIELVMSPRNDQLTAFNVYYSARSPIVAQQVTSELTNLFIHENLEVRQQQSANTTKFLERQLDDARQTLMEQEEKVRQFKEKHLGQLPGQAQSNLQILSGLQAQLQSEEDNLSRAKQQSSYLQTLLSQYRTLQASSKSGDAVSGGLPAIDQQLARLKSQLSFLSSHYTERHPDVRKVKEEIARTEKIKEQLTATLSNARTDISSDGDSKPSEDAGSPSPATLEIQNQLKANQLEITIRQRAIDATKRDIANYQGRLNEAPLREQEFIDITRGYEQSKANYDSLLQKKDSSEMATNLELSQQGEHFRILDPPSLPQRPYFPNRLKFCGIGLVVGLILGGGVAVGTEFVDDRIYGEEILTKLVPMKIMSEIPTIRTTQEQKQQMVSLATLLVATVLIVVSIAIGSAYTFFRG
jgi:polysaccharide chain length determinant protein (PEP-CTERM system associated)